VVATVRGTIGKDWNPSAYVKSPSQFHVSGGGDSLCEPTNFMSRVVEIHFVSLFWGGLNFELSSHSVDGEDWRAFNPFPTHPPIQHQHTNSTHNHPYNPQPQAKQPTSTFLNQHNNFTIQLQS
jgi:hypothetical protein